ncbi:MAG: alpha-N-acetylglucosaminidase [Tannerellaceae bacterium]|jgi:alpha-N-acetylglucosaminidase|nr:alpha-N-acetylglucosaminidase [Tannerellaceae bacterium]
MTKKIYILILFHLLIFSLNASEPIIRSSQEFNKGEIESVIKRIIPAHTDRFIIERIETEEGKDVFELYSRNNKIVLAGNIGVSVTSALNHYLKYYCYKEYSWTNMNPVVLKELPSVPEKVRKVSPHKYRYYLNYVTFNYTAAWWDWDRWEKELDWMALKGINMPLAVMGQDAVWQRVYRSLGFSDEQISPFQSGVAYSSWNWMGCFNEWQGPLPQSWIDSHEELQKKILSRARALGMKPILPAFTGHVTPHFKEVFPDAELRQVKWSVFPEVNLLDPADPLFVKIGEAFIKELTKTFGTDHLYSVDTFIEMTPPSSDSTFLNNMVGTIYESMAKADPKAVWVMQGWMFYFKERFWRDTQRKALLNAVKDDQLIMLDLWSDNRPLWEKSNAYEGKPWIWCMINNFGGNNSLFGKVDVLASGPATDRKKPNAGNMCGIGLAMEAIENNASMFEILLENTWTDQPIDVDNWISRYVKRRYESDNENAKKAWNILRNTVYNYTGDLISCGPRSVITIMPTIAKISQRVSAYSYYQPKDVIPAWEYMLLASKELKNNNSFQYDLLDLTRQMLANYSNELQEDYRQAFNKKDIESHRSVRKAFLELIDDMDIVMSARTEFMFGPWVEAARAWGTNDEERDLYERNAKNLLTLWHGPEYRNLDDYACRQWAGLLGQYYKIRWIRFFDYMEECLLKDEKPDMNSFAAELRKWQWEWIHRHTEHVVEPKGNAVELSFQMYNKYKDLMHI